MSSQDLRDLLVDNVPDILMPQQLNITVEFAHFATKSSNKCIISGAGNIFISTDD